MQVETSCHTITKIKNFIHENNVTFVGLITLILILTVIDCSLFLFYYCKCYTFVYSKLINFYERTHCFKNKRKLKNAGVFKNTQEPVEPITSVVLSTSPDTIKQDINERQQAVKSGNQPSPVLWQKLQLKTPRLIASHLTFNNNMI